MVSTAAARAPETKTALRPIRILREPARRRALPMRGDIGNSARRLKTRMGDCLRSKTGTGRQNELSSAAGTRVLGLTLMVAQCLQPCNTGGRSLELFALPVVQRLDAADDADAAPEDLPRARIPADVVRVARAPCDQRQPGVAGSERVRNPRGRPGRDDGTPSPRL